MTKKTVSLRVRNLNPEPIKVNDKSGNPILMVIRLLCVCLCLQPQKRFLTSIRTCPGDAILPLVSQLTRIQTVRLSRCWSRF